MNTNGPTCCQHLLRDSRANSPFGRIVSLGFYDGTTSGVARCSHCSKSYRYELIAWDSGQDLRVYSLSALPQGSFDALVGLLSSSTSPRWPLWSPVLQSDPAAKGAIDAELAKAEPPSCAIASLQLDKEILATKELTALARSRLPTGKGYPDVKDWEFWRRYLALESQPEPTP